MASVSLIRFIVVDTRCFSSQLLPCCEDFFFNLKPQLRQFFNLMFSSSKPSNSCILSLITVNQKVEVLMKPSLLELEKAYDSLERITFTGTVSTSSKIDSAIRALKMIDTCLNNFPLEATNIQISYITAHSLKTLPERDLQGILGKLGNRNPIVFIGFIHVTNLMLSPIQELVNQHLNCSVSVTSFGLNSLIDIFKGWLDCSSSREAELSVGDLKWTCIATNRILDVDYPMIEVCECHEEPLLGHQSNTQICSHSLSPTTCKTGLNICKSTFRELPVIKKAVIDLHALHRIALSSISEEALIGKCYVLTPENIIYSKDSESTLQFFALVKLMNSSDIGIICRSEVEIETMQASTLKYYYLLLPHTAHKYILLRRIAGEEQILDKTIQMNEIPVDDQQAKELVAKQFDILPYKEEYSISQYPTEFHSYLEKLVTYKPNPTPKFNDSLLSLRKTIASNSRTIANNLNSQRKRQFE